MQNHFTRGKKYAFTRREGNVLIRSYVCYGQTTLKQIVEYFVLSRNIW